MVKSKLILTKLGLICVIFFFTFGSFSRAEILQKATSGESSEKIDVPDRLLNIDTLLVIHFHPTVQCSCCIKVGIYAKEGLERFYAEPYKDSCIIFREYNIDEDTSTAKRYKIFWSALGFERFSAKTREFKEIESVWEICEDREKFLPNFKRELDEFMNEAKKDKSKAEYKQDVQKSTPEKPK